MLGFLLVAAAAAAEPDPLAVQGPTASAVPDFRPVVEDPVALRAEAKRSTRRGAWEIAAGAIAAGAGLGLVTIQQTTAAEGIPSETATDYDAKALFGAVLIVGGCASVAVGTLEIEQGVHARKRAEIAVGPGGVALTGRF
jgi:hypothetical protein